MREIKFRAWYQDHMSPVMTLLDIANNKHNISFNTLGQPHHAFTQLMQYTGLKDKHGVEIYEGDIVAWELSPQYPTGDTAKMAVQWMNSEQGWVPHIGSTTEVIGNIYETPELLKADDPVISAASPDYSQTEASENAKGSRKDT